MGEIFIDYPQPRPVFHLLYCEIILLIEAETVVTPTTMKMTQIESPDQML